MNDLDILNNDFLLITIFLLVFVYASLSEIELPKWSKDLLKNDFVKILFLCLILMISVKQSSHIAILMAVIFVVTLEYLNQQEMKENFSFLETFTGTLGEIKRIPKSNPITKNNKYQN